MTLSNSQRRTCFGPRWSSEHGLPRHSYDSGRSDNLSNPNVLKAIHADGCSQPQEQPIVLDERIPRTRWRLIDSAKYIPVSVFPVAYAVHRLYRHYKPRRLPTLTSLTLLELYLAAATPVLVRCLGIADAQDTFRDRDGLRIMLAARHFRHAMSMSSLKIPQSLKKLDANMSQTVAGREQQEHLRWLREGNNRSGNIIQRLVWWYRHPAWSDRSVWNGVALVLLQEYTRKPTDGGAPSRPPVETVRSDWDLCITFITTSCFIDQIEEWRGKAKNLFFASVPATWLARLSGRRLLYLPMGGVQRLLLGTFLYADWASHAGLFQHVKRIRDKSTFARLTTAAFGDVEKEADEFPKAQPSVFEEWWFE